MTKSKMDQHMEDAVIERQKWRDAGRCLGAPHGAEKLLREMAAAAGDIAAGRKPNTPYRVADGWWVNGVTIWDRHGEDWCSPVGLEQMPRWGPDGELETSSQVRRRLGQE